MSIDVRSHSQQYRLSKGCLTAGRCEVTVHSRGGLLAFVVWQAKCLISTKASTTAHGWGRAIVELGVRCVPDLASYAKPVVKRLKSDVG